MTDWFVSTASAYIHDGAERAVVSCLLNASPDASLVSVAEVSHLDFAVQPLGLAFATARELFSTGRPLDDESVAAASHGVARRLGLAYRLHPEQIHMLREWPSDMAAGYAQTVHEYAFLRRVAQFGGDIANLVADIPDSHSLYLSLQAAVAALRPAVALDGRLLDGVDMEGAYASIYADRIARAGVQGLDFPWALWNERVLAVEGSTLGILAAAPGTGKSTFLMQIAEHWARKKHVVYVDYELGRRRFLDRQMVRYGKVPLHVLRSGGDIPVSSLDAASEAFGLWRMRLHYFDANGLSAERLEVEVARLVDEGKCDALVVDYVNKIPASAAQAKLYSGNVYERQAADMEVLHSMAVLHDIPVWTAAQVTEKSQGARGKDRLSLSDIRGTSQYIDKAQVIVLASRRVVTDAPEVDRAGNVVVPVGSLSSMIELTVAKQNDGEGGDFKQRMDGFYTVRDVVTERVSF